MTFQVQNMLGDQALVSGTDLAGNDGKMIVSTTQWDELKARKNFTAAREEFDAAVEEFFAPITEAAEALEKTLANKTPDAAAYVVLSEEVEGVSAQPRQVVALTRDSIILRMIEEGNTDRLVWLSPTELGVLASS